MQTLKLFRCGFAAENDLGAAAADIHDQATRLFAAKIMAHAEKDESCFLAPRDDLDVVAENLLSMAHECGRIAGSAQCVGADYPDIFLIQGAQALREAF